MKKDTSLAFEHERLVVLVTNIGTKSRNLKTGDMVQTYIMSKDIDPVTAKKEGKDILYCGTQCPYRSKKSGGNDACYVRVHQAPLSVWRSWKKGNIKTAPASRIAEAVKASGKMLRIGSYGDPAMIPASFWFEFLNLGIRHVGYTSLWRTAGKEYRFLQASTPYGTESEAKSLGWKTFTVLPDRDKVTKPVKSTLCLSEARGKTCAECRLCNGVTKDVFIPVHGVGKYNLEVIGNN